jgi:ABC-type transport system substrate-binding protein
MRRASSIAAFALIAAANLGLVASAAAQDAAKETAAGQPAAPPSGNSPAAKPADGKPADAKAVAELPRLEEMQLPETEALLSGPRRDWVVLKDGRVLVVEPVFPRPNTLAKIQAERDAIMADSKKRFSPEGRQRLNDLLKMPIFLPGPEASTEYQIDVSDVQEVIHHEDLMLRRADRLIDEGETRKAFELLFVVARRDPTWPGLDERQVKLTAADVSHQLEDGSAERALALIESLYEHKPVPDVADNLLESAAAKLIGDAIDAQDYRQARFDLARVRQVDPRNRAIATWTQRLTDLATSLQADAERAAAAGDAALAATTIDRAAWAWPKLDSLRPVHARLTSRYQRLLVGVPSVASAGPLTIPTEADARVKRLTTAGLFEIDGFAGAPAYRSVYFERWEPTDLGRRARFELRQSLPSWAARPPLTALDVVALLSHRLQPGDPAYDARFADLVETLRVLGPYQFEVDFHRSPLRAESVLARTRFEQSPEESDAANPFRRFVETARDATSVTYRRASEEPEGAERHLAEVVEIAYPSYEKAIQAFDRGEVRMLTDVPAWDVPRLREDKRVVVTKSALPTTHLLLFHPDSQPLKSSELRRAIALSSNAEDLLRIVVGAGADLTGRLVTAPYPSTHFGYDPLVEPRHPDLPLSLALRLAAEKGFGGNLPELIFAAPAEAPLRQCAETLAKTWNRIGIPVRLTTFEELGPGGHWDIAFRAITVPDPVSSLAPLITMDPSVSMSSLADLPDWLRQRLIDLERAGDAATSQAVLIDLHRLLYADLRCVPLFEVDRFTVTRGAILGMPDKPIAVYEGAERWALPADYPEATP